MEHRPANVVMNWVPEDSKRPKERLQDLAPSFTEDLQGFGVKWRGTKKLSKNAKNKKTLSPNVPTGTGKTTCK